MKLVLQLTSIILFVATLIFSLSPISSLKEKREDIKYWGKKANGTNKPQEEEFELLN